MAKKNGNSENTSDVARGTSLKWGNGAKPIFVEGYLSAEDKQWLSSHLENQLVLISELLQSIEDEYTLSCKFDANSQRFLATLTCRVQNHHNSGCILVSRGATPVDAFYALAYRHFVKFEGEWRDSSGTSDSLWD